MVPKQRIDMPHRPHTHTHTPTPASLHSRSNRKLCLSSGDYEILHAHAATFRMVYGRDKRSGRVENEALAQARVLNEVIKLNL